MPVQISPMREAATARQAGAELSPELSRRQRIFQALNNRSWWLRASFALVFALYLRVVAFDKVYDDNLISDWGGDGWRVVPRFFLHDIFGSDGQTRSVYYRPLSMTYAYLVGWITGGAPGWLHLAALFLHLAVMALAFSFGRQLFRDERLALLTALLFGLHPGKVESVAWIGSSYVDALGAALFFATLVAFLKYRNKPFEVPGHCGEPALPVSPSLHASWGWLAASITLFAAALLTKETLVVIPFLIAALLWMEPSEAGQSTPFPARLRRFAVLLPYLVVAAVYMAVRHQIIQPPVAKSTYVQPSYTLNNLWTAPHAIWWYLQHLVMPWGLSVEYAPTVLDRPTLGGFALPASGLAVLALSGWLLWRRTRSATAVFLGFWFVLNLAPPVILATMVQLHDRYAYLSAYSFCALIAWAILKLGKLSPGARVAAGLGVVALWSAITWHETGFWDNDRKLFARAHQIAPSNLRVELQMAFLFDQAGEKERALGVLDDGLRYHPDSLRLLNYRGGLLAATNQTDAARAVFLRVLQLTEPAPGQPVEPGVPAHSRAVAAYKLSTLANQAGQFAEGERYARIAIGVFSDGPGYHFALAHSLRGQGRIQEADAENRTELRLRIAQQMRRIQR